MSGIYHLGIKSNICCHFQLLSRTLITMLWPVIYLHYKMIAGTWIFSLSNVLVASKFGFSFCVLFNYIVLCEYRVESSEIDLTDWLHYRSLRISQFFLIIHVVKNKIILQNISIYFIQLTKCTLQWRIIPIIRNARSNSTPNKIY